MPPKHTWRPKSRLDRAGRERQAGGRRGGEAVARQGLSAAQLLRRPSTVTLTWVGGAEPWLRARWGDQERLVSPDTLAWELLLRTKGWESPG